MGEGGAINKDEIRITHLKRTEDFNIEKIMKEFKKKL